MSQNRKSLAHQIAEHLGVLWAMDKMGITEPEIREKVHDKAADIYRQQLTPDEMERVAKVYNELEKLGVNERLRESSFAVGEEVQAAVYEAYGISGN